MVTALTALAANDDAQDRADAGEAAARFLDVSAAADLALHLVLDPNDTFPTLRTAAALARRADRAGWRVISEAIPSADSNQIEWIATAVEGAVFTFARDRDAALAICAELGQDNDPAVRAGASELVEWLAAIKPVLYPS